MLSLNKYDKEREFSLVKVKPVPICRTPAHDDVSISPTRKMNLLKKTTASEKKGYMWGVNKAHTPHIRLPFYQVVYFIVVIRMNKEKKNADAYRRFTFWTLKNAVVSD